MQPVMLLRKKKFVKNCHWYGWFDNQGCRMESRRWDLAAVTDDFQRQESQVTLPGSALSAGQAKRGQITY